MGRPLSAFNSWGISSYAIQFPQIACSELSHLFVIRSAYGAHIIPFFSIRPSRLFNEAIARVTSLPNPGVHPPLRRGSHTSKMEKRHVWKAHQTLTRKSLPFVLLHPFSHVLGDLTRLEGMGVTLCHGMISQCHTEYGVCSTSMGFPTSMEQSGE